MAEGRAEGRAEGATEATLAIATRLKESGMSISDISQITGLPVDEIEGL